MRVFSFAQESTRYCNYSKDKFGSELTFIIPYWTNIPEGQSYWHDGIGYRVGADIQNKDFGYIEKSPNYFNFLSSLEESEKCYLRLLNEGWVPQQARSILPNSLKTDFSELSRDSNTLKIYLLFFFKIIFSSNFSLK